jgi:hypothetical protein
LPFPTGSPESDEIQVLCRVPRNELCYFRYTLEAYEGLCLPTTLPEGEGLVLLSTSKGQRRPLESLLHALAEEIPIQVLKWSHEPPGSADSGT